MRQCNGQSRDTACNLGDDVTDEGALAQNVDYRAFLAKRPDARLKGFVDPGAA